LINSAQASILILLEVRKRFPEAFDHLEIFIDGGFERGSDILKAIALGATAVGIARPFLYSLVYGQKGVEHLSQSKLPPTMGSQHLLTLISSSER
jgi:L-lactate dehydrogenase (cytochrome)